MTRLEALEVAKQQHTYRRSALRSYDYLNGPAVIDADYGYRHGWYHVGDYHFSINEITDSSYDAEQGGWAYL